MSQRFSDDERLYFEVAKIRARRKSRNNVERRKSQPSSWEFNGHKSSASTHHPDMFQQREPRNVDEKLIMSILHRIRAKRNANSAVSSFPTQESPPNRHNPKVTTEKLYYTTEGTQTEDGNNTPNNYTYSTNGKYHQQKHQQMEIEDHSLIEGVVEDFDDMHFSTPSPHHISPNNNISSHHYQNNIHKQSPRSPATPTTPNNNHNSNSNKINGYDSPPPTLHYTYVKTPPQTPRNTTVPLTYSSAPSSSSFVGKPRPHPHPPHPNELFLPEDDDVYFSSPQQSPKNANSKHVLYPFSTPQIYHTDEETKMIEISDYRLTSDRIQKFRIAMSPSENKLLFPPNDKPFSSGTPIVVEWPPSSVPTYKSGQTMTALHHVSPPASTLKHNPRSDSPSSYHHSRHQTPSPSPTPIRGLPEAPSSSNLVSSSQQRRTSVSPKKKRPFSTDLTPRPPSSPSPPRSRLPKQRHTLTFGTPTLDQNGIHTYDYYDDDNSSSRSSVDGISFMEDDESDADLSESIPYDLAPSLSRARRHSLTQQSQTNNASPQLSSSPSRGPTSLIQPKKPPASTSGLQTIPSGQVVSFSGPASSSTANSSTDSSSTSQSEAPNDDLLQPLIQGAVMVKVSRKATAERRFFKVAMAKNGLAQLIWTKTMDSNKDLNSLNMRDVVNVLHGVPSAKLLQTTKKIPAVELASRVFSIVTRQRTLEIIAETADQRKIWVDALVHLHKNQASSTQYIQTRSPTPTQSSGKKSPFSWRRSKTPDL